VDFLTSASINSQIKNKMHPSWTNALGRAAARSTRTITGMRSALAKPVPVAPKQVIPQHHISLLPKAARQNMYIKTGAPLSSELLSHYYSVDNHFSYKNLHRIDDNQSPSFLEGKLNFN
jgi:hypothetical protein